jgi:hypothetical protein
MRRKLRDKDGPRIIYAIANPMRDWVKVGITNDINRRLWALQANCAELLQVKYLTDGCVLDEREIHWELERDGLRLRGEWFRWDESAVVAAFSKITGKCLTEADYNSVQMDECRKFLPGIPA